LRADAQCKLLRRFRKEGASINTPGHSRMVARLGGA
jgi:hypothetical protein